MNKSYMGQRSDVEDGSNVIVYTSANKYPLPLRLDVVNHSPTGFEWGYEGSGPSQLALALLCDYLGEPEVARAFYQEFKRTVVARFVCSHWTLLDEQIGDWFKAERREEQLELVREKVRLEQEEMKLLQGDAKEWTMVDSKRHGEIIAQLGAVELKLSGLRRKEA